MEETTFHPLDYVSVLRRRAWWFLVPLVFAIAAGVLLAKYLPKQYQATATLAVTSPTVSEEILPAGPRLTPEEKTRAISQQLLSDKVLGRVAQEEGLTRQMPLARAITMIRSHVVVTLPQQGNQADLKGFDTFQVSYTDALPEITQQVTNRIATDFVEETSRFETSRAEDTTAFIDTQLAASQQRLQALEARLRAAKESFMGSLPEQTDANLRTVAGLQQQLQSNATAMRSEQDRLSIIEQQIQMLQQGYATDATGAKTPADPSAAAAGRVVAAERALEAARATYTEKHPDVQRLKDELAAARAAALAEQARPPEDRAALLQADPAFKALSTDRDRSKLRINELQAIEANLRGEVAMYQKRVESAPRIEQQFVTLQREYDLEKQAYAEMALKRHSADLAQNIQQNASGERFSVLFPASLPGDPTTPNIPRLLLLSIVAGIVLGTGLAGGREYMDRAVHDARTLQRDYALPVLGEIPRIA